MVRYGPRSKAPKRLVIASLVALASLSGATPAEADNSIAFVTTPWWQVPFVFEPETPLSWVDGRLRTLTPGASPRRLGVDNARAPAWSPAGNHLAYVAGGRIRVARASGRRRRAVTPSHVNGDNPAWAPDGSALVFEQHVFRREQFIIDLWTVRPDGTGRRRLLRTDEAEIEPSWGADGRIAFARRGPGGDWDIHTWHPGTGQTLRITIGGADDRDPTWSRDGSRLAFSSEVADRIDIWTVRPDGTDLRRVTAAQAEEANTHPTWAADGSAIAYSAWGPFGNDHEIAVIPATGGPPRQLTSNVTDDLEPDWSWGR
jgi:TolB protein